ncbi:MAG: hypothetical protein K2G80_03295, partial [Bacteroidales bacterium]|nr:hypothetical protein [Bacteroidales bacterium]
MAKNAHKNPKTFPQSGLDVPVKRFRTFMPASAACFSAWLCPGVGLFRYIKSLLRDRGSDSIEIFMRKALCT